MQVSDPYKSRIKSHLSAESGAKMRYSGHHFSRLMRAGSWHSHPEWPPYLKRESRKVAVNGTAQAQYSAVLSRLLTLA